MKAPKFPAIPPTSRNVSFGEYAVKTYRSLSGQSVRRSYSNRPYEVTLDLSFENLPDEEAFKIFQHYHEAEGTLLPFELTVKTFRGVRNESPEANVDKNYHEFRSQLMHGPYKVLKALGKGDGSKDEYRWRYRSAPKMDSVFNGIQTISVSLVMEHVPQ